MSVGRHTGAAAAVVASLAAFAGLSAKAADTTFDPYIEAGGVTDDNYFLSRSGSPKRSANGGYAEAGIDLRAASPRTQWRIEPNIQSRFYSGDSNLNSTDYRLDGALTRIGQRGRFDLTAGYADEDIVVSDLPGAQFRDPLLGQSGATDSGRVQAKNRRRLLEATPSAVFDVSQRVQVRARLNLLDASYDQEIPGSQISFRSLGGNLGVTRRFSASSQWTVSGGYDHFNPDGSTLGSDISNLRLQWDYRPTERLSGYIRAGATRTAFDRATGTTTPSPSNQTGPLFGAGGQWRFLRSDLFLDAQRFVEGNGSGFTVERTDLRVQYTHRFTVKLSGYAALYGIRDEAVGASRLVYAPRTYASAAVGGEWRMLRSLSIVGRLEHAQQQFSGEGRKADRNSARLGVLYRPRRRD